MAVGIALMIVWTVGVVYLAGIACKRQYRSEDSDIIVKSISGEQMLYVPMRKDIWGKIYYGEFHRTSDGKWREQTYKNVFGDAFFTKRAIRLEYSDATETSRDTESIEMSRHLASVYDSNIREETHGDLSGKYSSHLVWVESPEV